MKIGAQASKSSIHSTFHVQLQIPVCCDGRFDSRGVLHLLHLYLLLSPEWKEKQSKEQKKNMRETRVMLLMLW